MRVPLALLIASACVVLFLGAFKAQTRSTGTGAADELHDLGELYYEYSDPLPCTELEEDTPEQPADSAFPQKEHMQLIGRMASGVRKIALQKGGGRWWNCGKPYKTEDEEVNASLEWAYRIVFLAWEYSDNGSDDGITINPWGIFGTAANESGFDKCALGPWPRKWGYEHKTITKRRLCISHPYSEIKATMLHPKGIERWKTSGIDAAPLHQLWRCDEKGMCRPKFNRRDPLPPIPLDEVFSLGKGFEYNVRKLKKDAIDFKTSRPWLYWPGHRSAKYDKKVTRWARKGGATEDEI